MMLAVVLMGVTAMAQSEEAVADKQDTVALANQSATDQRGTAPLGRPKVGVVLSGGGAKGAAHIGVLKVLERAGIPIDIITGTSVGSIVGGLYAIGYNADAIDSIVHNQDWSYVMSDRENMRRQSLSDRKKQNTYFFTTGMTLGKRDKNAGGLIRGKNLSELFQQLCTGYTDSLDFTRDLTIPFACVATDIVENEEIDFYNGRLPQVMRASMAVPAVFSPVRMGDMVLVDGAMKNNYPADLARKMGADIIIGVTVQNGPRMADELVNTMSIISQIIYLNCKNKYDENFAITDLHLQVDTKGFSTASFTSAAIDSLIRRGEEEAMRHWDDIISLKKRIGLDESFQPTMLQPRRPQVFTNKRPVTSYTFENMTVQDELFLRQKFHLKDKKQSGSYSFIDTDLEQQLTTCMRVDLFYQTAECRLVPDGDGMRVVLSAGKRKNVQLHAGFRFDTEEYATVQLGLNVPLKTAVPVSTDITLRLGKRLKTRAELTIHPRSFTRPTLSYEFSRNDVDIYMKGDLAYNILYNQFQGELTPFNFNLKNLNFQLGMRWDYMHYRNKLGSDDTPRVTLKNEHFLSYRARVNYDSEDNFYFPTRGSRLKAEYAYVTNDLAKIRQRADDGTILGKKKGMSEVSADWRTSFTFGRRFTLQPMVYGRLLFGSVVPAVFGNTIGGNWFGHYVEQQMPFAGIGNMEYVGHQFVAAQLQAQHRIVNNNFVLLRIAGAQQSDKVKEMFDHHTLFGIQAAYYYNTLFGPVGATLGYSNHTKEPYLFINLGYEF